MLQISGVFSVPTTCFMLLPASMQTLPIPAPSFETLGFATLGPTLTEWPSLLLLIHLHRINAEKM